MKYLVLFAETFGDLTGTVDRLFDDHMEAEIYCMGQNNAMHYVSDLKDKWRSEYWVVVLKDDQGSSVTFSTRILHP
jgi:hypothetical protein